MWLCRAGGEAVRRRLTISDARIGYRMSGLRPGLPPVLHRAAAHGRPPSVRREFPTVAPPPALHNVEDDAVAPVSEVDESTWLRQSPGNRRGLDMARDVSQERCELTCDRSCHHGSSLAVSRQAPVARAEPRLSLPCNLSNGLR